MSKKNSVAPTTREPTTEAAPQIAEMVEMLGGVR